MSQSHQSPESVTLECGAFTPLFFFGGKPVEMGSPHRQEREWQRVTTDGA
jgi:hypothetical protein